MNKKLTRICLSIFAVLLILTAVSCGGKDKTDKKDKDETQAEQKLSETLDLKNLTELISEKLGTESISWQSDGETTDDGAGGDCVLYRYREDAAAYLTPSIDVYCRASDKLVTRIDIRHYDEHTTDDTQESFAEYTTAVLSALGSVDEKEAQYTSMNLLGSIGSSTVLNSFRIASAQDSGVTSIIITTDDKGSANEAEESSSEAKSDTPALGNYKYDVDDYEKTASLSITENNQCSFSYSMISSYLPTGTYEVNDGKMVMTTDDKQYKYTFIISGGELIFKKGESSGLPSFAKLPDGAVFIKQ